MAIRIGDEAPDFKADSSQGPVQFHDYIKDSWVVFFSHPADFTPVCTTELARVSVLRHEWEKRKVKVIALSCDSAEDHKKWIADINSFGKTEVWYPIIDDKSREIATRWGMIDQTNQHYQTGLPLTVRNVFIIGPDKKIKLTLTYPAAVGRNFDEILRTVDALQLNISHKLATPADWTPGKDAVVLPAVSDEEAAKLYPKGFTKIRPYLRLTPDPRT